MSIAIKSLASPVPGRLYLSLVGIETEPDWAERLERDLGDLPGLHRIRASLSSGSVVLRFDPARWDEDGIVRAIGRVLDRPYQFKTASASVGRRSTIDPLPPLELGRVYFVDQFWNLDQLRPDPRRGWHNEGNPLEMSLRIGVLCHPPTGPDGLTFAFERAARRAELPVTDWRQQYRIREHLDHGEFLLCLRKRGKQSLALARGGAVGILAHCDFYQDGQGCHPLDQTTITLLRHRIQELGPGGVALAYRPLLFGQSTAVPLGKMILAGLASVDGPDLLHPPTNASFGQPDNGL